MRIERRRYVVMRRNRTEVWCGLSKHFSFRPITEVKDVSVKTYRSEAQARSGCSSWDRDFEVVPVIETIATEEALTLEELREMGGQPYWHVGLREESPPPHWNILDPFYAKRIEDYKYGENWIAYRRPPEGEEATNGT